MGDEVHGQRRPGPGRLRPLCHGPRNPPPSGGRWHFYLRSVSSPRAVAFPEWVSFSCRSHDISCLQLLFSFHFFFLQITCHLVNSAALRRTLTFTLQEEPHTFVHYQTRKTHAFTEKRPGRGLWKRFSVPTLMHWHSALQTNIRMRVELLVRTAKSDRLISTYHLPDS